MKDRTILALKGLAIIGVVFHHVTNRRLDPQAADWILLVIDIFQWCVLAFFCVSGYLQALSDSRKKRPLQEFVRLRVTRLLVPWVLLAVFYSCIWQILQALHIHNIGVKVPPTFIGKLEDVLWPLDSNVAQQLYFFPLLFAVSLVLVVVQAQAGLYGLWIAALVGASIGLRYYPYLFSSFAWGTFAWAVSFYAAGYLLYHYRAQKTAIRVALLAITIVMVIFSGYYGIIRVIPLWLLTEGPLLRLERVPLLERLGEASGTIYIYHTPFMVIPLTIAAASLPGPVAQFAGLLLTVAIAITLCTVIYELLKNSRAKVLLM